MSRVALALLGFVLAAGCIKQKDSLVVVALSASAALPAATQVTLTVATVTRKFPLPNGLPLSGTEYLGVYIEHDVTGTVNVHATADVGLGDDCVRYAASSSVAVVSAGVTVSLPLALTAMGSCSGAPGTDARADANGADVASPDVSPDVASPDGARPDVPRDLGTDGGADARGAGGTAGGTGAGGMTGTGGRGTGGAAGGTGGTAGGTGGAGGGMPPSLSLASCHEYLHSGGADCTLAANETILYSVAISPSGLLVVSVGDDGRAKVWRFDGHTLVAEGHVLLGAGFGEAAFSPDGTILAVGWSTGVDLWNVATWSRLRTLVTAGAVDDVAFTPDGQQVISVDSTTLYAHAIGSPAALHTQAIAEGAWAVAVSPVASTTPAIAVATRGGTVRVFTHGTTGFVSAALPLPVNTDSSITLSVRFSPDGRLLAAGGSQGLLHLWNYPITTTVPSPPDIDVDTPALSSNINMVAFHPGGRYLAVAGGFFSSLTTWNTAAPRTLVASYLNPTRDLLSLVFSPGGTALIAGEAACGLILVCAD